MGRRARRPATADRGTAGAAPGPAAPPPGLPATVASPPIDAQAPVWLTALEAASLASLLAIGAQSGATLVGLNAVRRADRLALVFVDSRLASRTRHELVAWGQRGARVYMLEDLAALAAPLGRQDVRVLAVRAGSVAAGLVARLRRLPLTHPNRDEEPDMAAAPTSPSCYDRLPRAEVIKAVERRGPRRVPLAMARWWGEGLGAQYGDQLAPLARFPEDVAFIGLPKFDVSAMGLSWELPRGGAHDNRAVIDDWSQLDEFIAKLPDPAADPRFEELGRQAAACHAADTYLIVGWWGLFFETPWGLRGMENLMVDYYQAPEHIHRLHDALCQLYCRSIAKAAEVMAPDGFWTSDDLGHQTQPMMRRQTFDALLKPYYDRIGALLQQHGIHWWLHSCGNNTELLPSLIDAGVRMFHPVQKHTMDEAAVAAEFGGKVTFLAGFDVQHLLVEGTPDEVRAEVRWLIDRFDRPEGGMCLAAGNGIVSGTPFENIEAFLDESISYGATHRRSFGS